MSVNVQKVRSFECLAYMLESCEDWVSKGDGRLTILYDAFFRLTFAKDNGKLDVVVRQVPVKNERERIEIMLSYLGEKRGDFMYFNSFTKVMDQFLLQLVLGAWCSQGALYASLAFSQMKKIVGFYDESVKSSLRAAFTTDMKTPEQIAQADRDGCFFPYFVFIPVFLYSL